VINASPKRQGGSELTVLPRAFYDRDPLVVAPELLGKLLVRGRRSARIVEVEAYRGSEDPASHAYRGMTRRNATMFGPPGHLYVYFTYGMHWCANAVCWPAQRAGAVLLRALAPQQGLDEMWESRPRARIERDLCSGPAKLCQAFGLDGSFDGADLVTGERGVVIADNAEVVLEAPSQGERIGITPATGAAWRWWVSGDPNVSRPGGNAVRGLRRDEV
jgi:DNA-3-methyladenine glycosylase